MVHSIKTEILSPAGSIQALYAGIHAGADAVYIGGNKFGARAYADNPEEKLLLEAIDYAHILGKKIYLTVNTLLKNQEIEEYLYEYLLPYYENGLDAVIVQDLGVFQFIKNNFPKLDIHASTQMVITGKDGAILLKEMGASRIVTAREITLKEIRNIHDNVDIEIESFIHGAMCYAYSGQCLFSSILGGRSGNRGRCAGPCRQPYCVYENKNLQNDLNSQYVLSLRDMNTLSILPQIINAGVYSLKIEGRMKSPEYVAGTVEMYRKYTDIYHSFSSYEEALEQFRVQDSDMEKLAGLYSRSGSKTGYYLNYNSKNMISLQKPAYSTNSEEYVSELNEKYVKNIKKYECNARIELKPGERSKIILSDENGNYVNSVGEVVSIAKNRPMTYDDIHKQISKTGNTGFHFKNIDIHIEDGIFIPIKQLNELRRNAIDLFKHQLVKDLKRSIPKKVENQQIPHYKEIKTNTDVVNRFNLHCFITTNEQFLAVIENDMVKEIIISSDFLSEDQLVEKIAICKDLGKEPVIAMPFIFREEATRYFDSFIQLLKNRNEINLIRFMVRNVDEIGYLRRNGIHEFITDSSVYALNNYAVESLRELGAERITYPYELNYKELLNLSAGNSEIIVYGRIPLMISANCINQTLNKCDKTKKILYIKDRIGKNFSVVNVCNYCYNVIYNNYPLSLLGVSQKVKRLKPESIRISFTTETALQTKNILETYISVYYNNKNIIEKEAYTRGHFNRGVE